MDETDEQNHSPLVTTGWLSSALKDKQSNLVVIDATIPMPGEKRDCGAEFRVAHIPGARFLDLLECRDKDSKNSYMLPKAEIFERFMNNLGVSNDSQVVLYDYNEKKGMFSCPRAWWMFRVFGHSDVRILDCGMVQWRAAGNAIESGESIVRETSGYKAVFNPTLVRTLEEVKDNLSSKQWQLIDARSEARFTGQAPEPRADIKPGHIPEAKNMFWANFLTAGRKYKSPEELKAVYEKAGIDPSKPHTGTCGAGVSACYIPLTSYILGFKDVPVYDGSWMDWFQFAPDDLKIDVPTTD